MASFIVCTLSLTRLYSLCHFAGGDRDDLDSLTVRSRSQTKIFNSVINNTFALLS
ncbi:hypothetical protein [Oxynema sp. CENA135]|uniref:hypothetical protein n=1 Tax=Oxynema sp. CENA135 TaxID=984206 RepID=UPI00190E1744|nr:hypothetical protein [Oxynema sp. CENA135]